MKLYDNEQQAIIGINVELSTQEQIILKDLIQPLKQAVDKQQNKNFKDSCRVDLHILQNMIVFVEKLTQNVPSMEEAHNELFDIIQPQVVGKIDLD